MTRKTITILRFLLLVPVASGCAGTSEQADQASADITTNEPSFSYVDSRDLEASMAAIGVRIASEELLAGMAQLAMPAPMTRISGRWANERTVDLDAVLGFDVMKSAPPKALRTAIPYTLAFDDGTVLSAVDVDRAASLGFGPYESAREEVRTEVHRRLEAYFSGGGVPWALGRALRFGHGYYAHVSRTFGALGTTQELDYYLPDGLNEVVRDDLLAPAAAARLGALQRVERMMGGARYSFEHGSVFTGNGGVARILRDGVDVTRALWHADGSWSALRSVEPCAAWVPQSSGTCAVLVGAVVKMDGTVVLNAYGMTK